MSRLIGLPRNVVMWAVAIGVALGGVYAMSPLTVVAGVAFVVLIRWAGSQVDEEERRWLYAILITAIALRVVAVAGLFALTDHRLVPFGRFFGDEEYFMRRSLWMRNIALGLPVSGADFIYAFEDYGRTSYMYLLALVDVLFGPAPYGAHLLGGVLYVGGSIVLYRVVRPAFGRPASLVALALLLFMPSLFAWSISALKEPLFFAVMSLEVAAAVAFARAASWGRRTAAAAALLMIAIAAQTVRDAGFALAAGGAVGGIVLAFSIVRPRLVLASMVAGAIVLPIALTRGKVQDRVVAGVRATAFSNWGHVNTPGYVYETLSPYMYRERSAVENMTFQEGAQYIVRSLVSYVIVPAPWQVRSRAALSFLPEQTVWYVLVLLAPVGMIAGLRRDATLACVLLAFAAVAVVLVAVSNGNVGTLVRHRGLALPYIVWLSALGACELAARCRKEGHVDYR